MAWSEQTGEALGRGALILRKLRTISPGKAMRITRTELADIIVPANPFDRQTAEYLIEWFRVRLPFYARVQGNLPDPFSQHWDFYRPTAEELDRWGRDGRLR